MNVIGGCRADHRIALRIERGDGDWSPVPGVPCPAPRAFSSCLLVERMANLQHVAVLSSMSLCRADIADATVAMIVVVPVHDRACPLAGVLQIREALRRELRQVLGGAEHRCHGRVVVADAWAGVRGPQSQPTHHGQHRCRLERRTVFAVQYRHVVERVQALDKRCAAQQVHDVLGVVARVHLEADDLAAIQIQDQVQIEPATHHGGR